MRKNNVLKETIEKAPVNSEELWWSIRYLDPDLDHRRGDIVGIVAALLVIFSICLIGLAIHFRGL